MFDRRILDDRIYSCAIPSLAGTDLILPIPQSFDRAWLLNGSPARVLAEQLGSQLEVPLIDLLVRSRGTHAHQAKLDRMERMQNPIVFQVSDGKQVRGRKVLLVDDFVTTGRTLQAASHALLASSAMRVSVWCLGIRPPVRSNSAISGSPR